MTKKFKNLFIFYVSYLWFVFFSGSILPTHFLKEGLSLNELVLGRILLYLAPIPFILFLTSFGSKRAWKIAPVLYLIYVLLSIRILSASQYYLANIFAGFTVYFFWLFYNIAHFNYTPKERIGFSSGAMFGVGPVMHIVAPLIAGYIASQNINLLWIFSFFFFLWAYYLTGKQEDFRVRYSIQNSLRELRATRWFIFLQGVWEALYFGIIPFYTLIFIKEPLFYGTFIAYLALIAAVSNLVLGRFTDKIQKRSVFLYPLVGAMIIVTCLFAWAVKDINLWILTTGLFALTLPTFWNLTMALVVDAHSDLNVAIPGRELILAVGRVLGLTAVLVSFYYERTPFYIFFFLAGALVLFLIILYWNTRISKKFKYL